MTPLISMAGRIRYVFAAAATLLPVVAFMLAFFLTAFQPVFQSMETIVRSGYQEVRPLHELEIALLRAAMPPHGYLVHGIEEERGHWQQAKERVETAFATAQAGVGGREREVLLGLQRDWTLAESQVEDLFRARPGRAGRAMESFDVDLDGILRQVRSLISDLEQNLHDEYLRVAERKHEGTVLASVIILLSLVSGLAGGVWLSQARRTIMDQSLRDPLTGILNRRALQSEFAKLQARILEAENPASFSVLLLDLDHFKAVNDRYGHDVGDLALKSMALTTAEAIRNRDVFGRYGGEEFVVLLPGTGMEGARVLAERIRRRIASNPVQLPDGKGRIQLTVSIGCATNGGRVIPADEVLRQADQAMYAAKRAGRNRVACRD